MTYLLIWMQIVLTFMAVLFLTVPPKRQDIRLIAPVSLLAFSIIACILTFVSSRNFKEWDDGAVLLVGGGVAISSTFIALTIALIRTYHNGRRKKPITKKKTTK